ncbi:type I DNA topoisomerase [bacterium]|nr:type I DNA topoisomerase [candidate division CSSED10-310 bacterium]
MKSEKNKKKLVIVESPAKARTVTKILGGEYRVLSSVGHVRDLPKTRFGIDVESDFSPEYVTISGKQNVIEAIRTAARDAGEIYLAADPDREGEAICWHLVHYLKGSNAAIYRILYHEITPAAIRSSLEKRGDLNMNKVNAQQARRVLDRIVGYRWSPLLWKKIKGGLSAGRVQSVALKIICDREREIQAFVPKEYWIIAARLKADAPPEFEAVYHGSDGKRIRLSDQKTADAVFADIRDTRFEVSKITQRRVNRRPPPPFITSTLQQEAARRHRFPAQKTMRLAQQLYEGKTRIAGDVHGLITYMRTDSPRIGRDAQEAARVYIERRFGADFNPSKPPFYKARKGAQEAHEAIRPTDVELTPEKAAGFLQPDELKLYRLIWERFIASQMKDAVLNVTTVVINAGSRGNHQFRATGTEIMFEGYYRLTGMQMPSKPETGSADQSGQILPSLSQNQLLECLKLTCDQKFTKPPSRFSEATLVKELETLGIGRPSTYASIMSTIRGHDYVEIIDRKFKPTELGFMVADMLTRHFPDIMSVQFTARMETRLDDVEKGSETWVETVRSFYSVFAEKLAAAETGIDRVKPVLQVVEGVECPLCKGPMVIRKSKKGPFLSCQAFPGCKGALPIRKSTQGDQKQSFKSVLTGATCQKCGARMALRTGRYGLFLTCSRFPACREKAPSPAGLPCPSESCDGRLTQRRGKRKRTFWGCTNYPKCTVVFTGVPVLDPCPGCGFPYRSASLRKTGIFLTCPRCHHTVELQEERKDNGDGDTEVYDVS